MLPNTCWARFRRFGDRWFAFTGVVGSSGIDTLQLVIDAPEFLGTDATQSLPRAAMASPQSQSNRVLMAVDEAGGVQLAVCPEPGADLAVVVGDLLATGRRFWRKGYDALAGPFKEFLGMPLTDWIAARVSNGWSADKFRVGLERSLAQGKFPITIVVNEIDPAVKETLDYLREINQQVRVLGYTCQTGGGDELVWPKELSEEQVAAPAQPARQQPRQSTPERRPMTHPRPQPGAEEGSTSEAAKPAPSAKAQRAEPTEPGPPPSDAASKRKEILDRLTQLDDLGLMRKGLEYFRASDRTGATATAVLAVDPDRWPFPKPQEVIVVVNTGREHMAGFLNVEPTEVEEFLGSLPRVEQKEHKGALLLRAASVTEANQIVNELRALKEVTGTRVN